MQDLGPLTVLWALKRYQNHALNGYNYGNYIHLNMRNVIITLIRIGRHWPDYYGWKHGRKRLVPGMPWGCFVCHGTWNILVGLFDTRRMKLQNPRMLGA